MILKQPREFFKDTVLPSGQRAIDLDTGNEYVGDGITAGGLLVESDFVQATTAQLTGKIYPLGTMVFDTTLGTLVRSNGSTPAEALTPIGGGGGGGLQSCRVASTADISDLASVTTLDGETLVDGDVVLLKDQSTASQNGVYEFTLATTTLARLSGYAGSEDFQNKSVLVFVREGAANEDKIFHTDNDGSFVLGTTAMAWEDYRDLTISDVAGLTAALAGKSDTGHGHAQSDITDLVSDLAGKEPSIGAKGTAFNKNFGTSTGDVAEGDDARITGALQSSNDLSDLSNASSARNNLGLGDAAERLASDFLQTSNDLYDLSSASNARSNLGLGDAATKNTGTLAGEVAAGDDSRFPTSDEKAGLAANSPTAANPVITQGDTSTTPTADKVPKADGSGNLDPSWLALLSAFNGNSQLVQLAADGKLPAVDGSSLTGLDSTVNAALDVALRGTENRHLGAFPEQPFNSIDSDFTAFVRVREGVLQIVGPESTTTVSVGIVPFDDPQEPDIEFILPSGARLSSFSGDGDTVGLNGQPNVQGYRVDLGATSTRTVISGGTF